MIQIQKFIFIVAVLLLITSVSAIQNFTYSADHCCTFVDTVYIEGLSIHDIANISNPYSLEDTSQWAKSGGIGGWGINSPDSSGETPVVFWVGSQTIGTGTFGFINTTDYHKVYIHFNEDWDTGSLTGPIIVNMTYSLEELSFLHPMRYDSSLEPQVNSPVYFCAGYMPFGSDSNPLLATNYRQGNTYIFIQDFDPLPFSDFTAAPRYGTIPLYVQFTDLSTGFPMNWSWDFGDGTISEEKNPLHKYEVAGTYTISLNVTNPRNSNLTIKAGYITATMPSENLTATPYDDFLVYYSYTGYPYPEYLFDEDVNTKWGLYNYYGKNGGFIYTNPNHRNITGLWVQGQYPDGCNGCYRCYKTETPSNANLTLQGSIPNTQGGSWHYNSLSEPTTGIIHCHGNGWALWSGLRFATGYEPPPPIAGFTATPLSGPAPLTVQFNDTSTGAPATWTWDFGDGTNSTGQNPSHTYEAAGTYDVSLTAANAAGDDTMVKAGYINVTGEGPVADFTGTPLSGDVPLDVQFTDNSTGDPTSWSWDFGDGNYSTNQNPVHTYLNAGTYTVNLTVDNSNGNNTKMREGYVTVTSGSGYPNRYVFVETGTQGATCVEPDANEFREALFGQASGQDMDSHGWQDYTGQLSLPIYYQNAHADHWAINTGSDYVDKADFAYFHGHGSNAAVQFDNSNALTPSMAQWGYEKGSLIKWITFHSCLTLNDATWEQWKNSFYGLHMILGYNTTAPCTTSPATTGQEFAKLMRGESTFNPATLSIKEAWKWANRYTIDDGNFFPAAMYVVDCGNDYLPGFGSNCGDPQRTLGEYSIVQESWPAVPETYAITGSTLEKTQNLEITDGIYLLNAMVEPIPEKIMVYSTMKPDLSSKKISKLSQTLQASETDMSDKNFATDEEKIQDWGFFNVQKRTGIISYEKTIRKTSISNPDTTQTRQSKEDAANHVSEVLTEAGLMPSDAVIDQPRFRTKENLAASATKEIKDEGTIVYLHREIDGIRVVNSKVIAEVDSNNDITSMFMNWRDYSPDKEVETRTYESAFREFKTRKLHHHIPGDPEKIVITDVSLRYYSQVAAMAATEKYLQPVFVFEGYVQKGDMTESFEPVYISATKEQFDRIPGCADLVCS